MQFSVTQDGYTMTADLQVVGLDWVITVTGGDNPHVGVVTTMARQQAMQTICYPSHDGRLHKDNFISERIARKLQPQLTGSATILAGVHVNQISKRQIAAAAPMSDDLAAQILAWLQAHPQQVTPPQYYHDGEQPH